MDDSKNYTPKDIAQVLFSKEPAEPCTYMILAYEDGGDILYVFEILITLLMEALDFQTGGLDTANLDDFTIEHLTALSPWFESVGFKLLIEECDKDDSVSYNEYYCKVRVKTRLHETFFIMKNIAVNYHFLLNGDNLEANQAKTVISTLYAVFINDNNKVYKIGFDFIGPSSSSCR
jgi:hypothetical protein